MALINASKKIVPEDYAADTRDTVKRLATTLNPFLDQSSNALSNQLTLKENLKAKVWTLDLDAGVSTYTVSWGINEKPTDVHIGYLAKRDGSAPAAAFAMHWTYADSQVFLTFLGLNAATAHVATVIGQV